jgi:demethylmenaquinone methyltransferase/2-methoxy-6-polyprenyl-1,4-benzoquinol methylase
MNATENSTHFGFRDVPLAEKQRMVDDVFHSVAGRYDLMNDLMSAGMHRAWKDALVSRLRPPIDARKFAVLDVAGGTGDIAFRIAAAGGSGINVTVADINGDMLAVGRERAAAQGLDHAIRFAEANAEALPFPDKSFDG